MQAKQLELRLLFFATRVHFTSPETEVVPLVDASNALNRKVAPSGCVPLLSLCYSTRDPSHGSTLKGTTQGDPLAMPMYTLIRRLNLRTWWDTMAPQMATIPMPG